MARIGDSNWTPLSRLDSGPAFTAGANLPNDHPVDGCRAGEGAFGGGSLVDWLSPKPSPAAKTRAVSMISSCSGGGVSARSRGRSAGSSPDHTGGERRLLRLSRVLSLTSDRSSTSRGISGLIDGMGAGEGFMLSSGIVSVTSSSRMSVSSDSITGGSTCSVPSNSKVLRTFLSFLLFLRFGVCSSKTGWTGSDTVESNSRSRSCKGSAVVIIG